MATKKSRRKARSRQRAGGAETGQQQKQQRPGVESCDSYEEEDEGVRMGQGASTTATSDDHDHDHDEVARLERRSQELFQLTVRASSSSEHLEHRPPQLAELSDHLSRKFPTDSSFTNRSASSSRSHRSGSSIGSANVGPDFSSLLFQHPVDSSSPSGSSRNRTEPTTRSSSPSPSEEGQEVVHNDDDPHDDTGMDEELSSIETTTGADVGLMLLSESPIPSPSPLPSPSPISNPRFFEEKKDEDVRGSGMTSSSPRKSRSGGDAAKIASSSGAAVKKSPRAGEEEETDSDNDFQSFRDRSALNDSSIALTPSREPYRRPSNEVISSSDSGFYTATQQSSDHVRRASQHDDDNNGTGGGFGLSSSDGSRGSPSFPRHLDDSNNDDDDASDEHNDSHRARDRANLVVEGCPPQPVLDDDEEEEDHDLNPPEALDAEERSDDAICAGSSDSRSDLPSDVSRDSPSPVLLPSSPSKGGGGERESDSKNKTPKSSPVSLAPKSLRRTSEYDSVVASLHTSLTFKSAQIRLAPPTPPIVCEEKVDNDSAHRDSECTSATVAKESAVAPLLVSSEELEVASNSPGSVGSMMRKSSALHESSQDAGGIELAQASVPANAGASAMDASPSAPASLSDLALNGEIDASECVPHSDTPSDEEMDDGSAVHAGAVATEAASERDDESQASNEARPGEPHWLLRSELGEPQENELPKSHDATANESHKPIHDDVNNPAYSKAPGEKSPDGSPVESRPVNTSSSPVIISSSPDSEPGYVLLGGRSDQSRQGHSVEVKCPSLDGEMQERGSAPSSEPVNETLHSSGSPEIQVPDVLGNSAPPETNDRQDDQLSIPRLNEHSRDSPRRVFDGEAKQSSIEDGHTHDVSSPALTPGTAKANAIAAATAAIQGHLRKLETKASESQKVVKTIQGSPTLAERKAALYTPRKAGKRDPESVLQLKERALIAIESEDECDDDDENDFSLLTPRQLDRSLTGSRSRSGASCDSRSVTSDHGPTTPASPWPTAKNESTDPPQQANTVPTQSLRDGLRRQDSEPVPRVVSKESETLSTLSTASLHTPSTTSSPMIFRTPMSLSKRLPSDPKRMSDLIRLDLWSRDPGVVESALVDLVKFASESKNHGTMARTGGLLAVVRAMETHLDHDGVQVQACRCLEKLAIDHDNELAIGDVGGIEAILGAMMSHCDDCRVQEAAWAALWNLTCGNADNQLVVDAAGGIEVLVQCMTRHSDHPEVQKNACGTLANLCLDNEDRLTALAEAGGFVAISMALQKHWKHPDVRNEASYAMTILLGPRAESYDVPVAHAPQQKPNIDA